MVAIRTWVSAQVTPFSVEVSFIFRFFEDGLLLGCKLLFTVSLMILLEDNKEVCLGMDLNLAWRVPRFKHFLGELFSRVLNLHDAKSIVGDGDDTFGTSL